MSRRKHSKAEVTAALKQVEAGRKVEDVAGDIGVTKHKIYDWKNKYGGLGLEVRKAQRLRRLENQNRRLKKLLTDLSLDREMLKALITKNRPELVDRRTDANWLREQFAVSERRVCGLLSMAVSSYRYVARRCDEELRDQLVQLAREEPRFGYRRLHMLLRGEGETANHKRVYRVYREAGLCLRSKKLKHRISAGAPLPQDATATQELALDSAHHVPAAEQDDRAAERSGRAHA